MLWRIGRRWGRGGRLVGWVRRMAEGERLRGVRMSAIAMQWEVVLKIPIDTWALTHKQGHRQTHKAVSKEVSFMHQRTHIHHMNATVRIQIIHIKALKHFIPLSLRCWRAPCQTERRPFSSLKQQVLWTNKPSCHILTHCRRKMGESCSVHTVLNAHCGKQCVWVYLAVTHHWDSLPSADHLKKRDP